ncbi:uncharacterized protein IL334_004865 [Kwoniella shivajii]|uniref:Calpain catalytic domain-containing protein n=1 Tax=Kwoniella shivajii TaxID=564305 RepID=A0ABZ1D1Y5_9TREE|nr:hypothetical protein IL334_004865 [Kwoniella shivajii]
MRMNVNFLYTLILILWAGPLVQGKPVDIGGDGNQADVDTMQLWGEQGPVVTDILQGPDIECWLLATLAALVKLNMATITNIVKDIGIGEGVYGAKTDQAEVTLLNKDGKTEKIKVDKQSSSAGTADHLTTWWPAAIKRAAMNMGGYEGLKENSIEYGYATNALRMLTGKSTSFISVTNTEDAWDWIKHSNSSPILVSTKGDTKKLRKNHVLAVMSYEGDDTENGRVRIRDPYNGVEWYDLKDIVDDIKEIAGLADFASVP